MDPLSESTVNLLLSALMGLFGGLITVPINGIVSWLLKRDEQLYQHKLDLIAKQRELLLQHQLEMKRSDREDDEIAELRASIGRIERRLNELGPKDE